MKPKLTYCELYKICSLCKGEKFYIFFNKTNKDGCGLHSVCKTCSNDYSKIYRLKYAEKLKEQRRLYNNKRKQYRNFRDRNKYHNNINFKMSQNLRTRMRRALKGISKMSNSFELIGCHIDELKKYLESKFEQGMNWDNYGSGENNWNIDHTKPCCLFNLSQTEEQKKCFHYTNLKPMWYIENLRKNRFYV